MGFRYNGKCRCTRRKKQGSVAENRENIIELVHVMVYLYNCSWPYSFIMRAFTHARIRSHPRAVVRGPTHSKSTRIPTSSRTFIIPKRSSHISIGAQSTPKNSDNSSSNNNKIKFKAKTTTTKQKKPNKQMQRWQNKNSLSVLNSSLVSQTNETKRNEKKIWTSKTQHYLMLPI